MPYVIKICGLRTREALDAAISAGADMIGLVFFPRSPRAVSLDDAAALAGVARRRAEIVALTVNMDDAALAAMIERVEPDWLQLHGTEPPARVAAVRARFGLPVVKAIGIRDAADVAAATAQSAVADRLLLDARPPKAAPLPGGNGVPFDWRVVQGFRPSIPYLLSGGLDAGNVGEAVRRTGADGVDVSSGVERAPGDKDVDLIAAFVAAARDAFADRRISA